MSAVLDLFRVLWEPTAVFTRVSEQPKFWRPYIALAVIQVVIVLLMLPYTRAVTEAVVQQQMQARGQTGPAPNIAMLQYIGVAAQVIILPLILLISTGVLWATTSIFGGEGKFSLLLSVATYSAIWFLIQLAATLLVIMLKGVENIQSQEDLQPAFGLDLAFPGAKGFVGFLLKGVNPFAILGYWTIGTGISVTHKLDAGTGRKIAFTAFLIMTVIGAALGATCTPKPH